MEKEEGRQPSYGEVKSVDRNNITEANIKEISRGKYYLEITRGQTLDNIQRDQMEKR